MRAVRLRFRRDERAVALIEFALSLPLLILLVMGGMELAHWVISWQTVTQVANLAADNASRGDNALDESDISQIFTGVGKASQNFGLAANGRVILSGVQQNAGGTGLWIRWQRCFGSYTAFTSAYGVQDKGKADASLQNIDGVTPTPGSAIILVEAAYNYQPVLKLTFLNYPMLKHKAMYVVRQRTDFSLTNNSGLTPATC